MSNLFNMARVEAQDSSGGVSAGAKLEFFTTGTSTNLDSYSDEALTTANANPVVADSGGRWAAIFLKDADYKVILSDANDVQIWSADPYHGGSSTDLVIATGATATTSRSLADRFAEVFNPQDFGAKADGTTNDTASVQAAIDAASLEATKDHPVVVDLAGALYLLGSGLTVTDGDGLIIRDGSFLADSGWSAGSPDPDNDAPGSPMMTIEKTSEGKTESFRMENVLFDGNFVAPCLHARHVKDSVYIGCIFEHWGTGTSYGFFAEFRATNSVFVGCHSRRYTVADSGFDVAANRTGDAWHMNAADFQMFGCYGFFSGRCIVFRGKFNADIIGCHFYQGLLSPVVKNEVLVEFASDSHNINMMGCYLDKGVLVFKSFDHRLDSCRFVGNDTDMDYFFNLNPQSVDVKLFGFQLLGCRFTGAPTKVYNLDTGDGNIKEVSLSTIWENNSKGSEIVSKAMASTFAAGTQTVAHDAAGWSSDIFQLDLRSNARIAFSDITTVPVIVALRYYWSAAAPEDVRFLLNKTATNGLFDIHRTTSTAMSKPITFYWEARTNVFN